MNEEHIRAAALKLKGGAKDAIGGLTGDRRLQVQGKLEKARGAVHHLAGNAKDAVRDAAHWLRQAH